MRSGQPTASSNTSHLPPAGSFGSLPSQSGTNRGSSMSDQIGPIAVLPQDGRSPFLLGGQEMAERTHELVDAEVRRLVEGASEEVTDLLRSNRDKLDALAHALLEKETLEEDEAYAAAGMTPPPEEEREPEPAEAPA